MKLKKSWISLLSLVAIVAVGCASSGGTVSEESLGLRKVDLYSEDSAKPEATQYSTAAPGTSKRFDRAYENAPPMIPHSVEGLLPIKVGNNACLGCHMPEVASSMGATPIPPSHFTNYRPTTVLKGGNVVKEGKVVGKDIGNTSDIKLAKAKKLNHLYQGRFNCSQCHAPQSTQEPLVKNTFTPDFKSKDGAKKSNLMDVINEGVE
jgi:cytochrome c-type protein NapB